MHKIYKIIAGLFAGVVFQCGLYAAANAQQQMRGSRPRLPERFYQSVAPISAVSASISLPKLSSTSTGSGPEEMNHFESNSIEYAKKLYKKGKLSAALAVAEQIALDEKQELRDRADSLALLGDMYSQGGNGIERNLERALEKYKKIWGLADHLKLLDLGPSYFWRINGKIRRINDELQAQEGLQLLQSALPSASSSFGVGLVHENAAEQLLAEADAYLDGTVDLLPDHAKALNLYLQVLDLSDRSDLDTLKAYGGIADIYLVGTHGVPVDHKKALEYFEKAFALAQAIQNAEQMAIYSASIGGLHFIGGEGIEKDYSKALDAYAYAIEHAHLLPEATQAIMYFNLGDMYRVGQMGAFGRNLKKALSYYLKINVPDLTYPEAAQLTKRMREIYEFLKAPENALVQAKKHTEYLQAWLKEVNRLFQNEAPMSQEQIDNNWQIYYEIQEKLKEGNNKIRLLQSAIRKRTGRSSDTVSVGKRQRTLRGGGVSTVEDQSLPETTTSTLLQGDEIYNIGRSPSPFSNDSPGTSSRVLLDDEPEQRVNLAGHEKPLLLLEDSSDDDSQYVLKELEFPW